MNCYTKQSVIRDDNGKIVCVCDPLYAIKLCKRLFPGEKQPLYPENKHNYKK